MTDCVILAAGRGTRLRGVVPQFHKPLMTVDGKAMIVRVIEEVEHLDDIGRIVVVVAPDNAGPIVSLLCDAGKVGPNVRIIVQPRPDGPGGAFVLASELIDLDTVLLLMADNIFGDGDVQRVLAAAGERDKVIVGGRFERDVNVARRFTRVTYEDGCFEGTEVHELTERSWSDHEFFLWIGPLAVNAERLRDAIKTYGRVGDEYKIGPVLGRCGKIRGVECKTHDVGDLNGA